MRHYFLDIKNHFSHYLALFLILSIGFFSFFYFKRMPQVQLISAFLTAVFYVLWGIFHHLSEGDLHIRIVLEYIAIALLGFVILWTAVNRV